MNHDRWNGTGAADAENSVNVTLCGTHVTLAQDATSMNCGTTAWDASFVLAKYLERNLSNLEGKIVVELGAGISVATKASQLWHVGAGLPLDALKKGSIVDWACSYTLDKAEVVKAVRADKKVRGRCGANRGSAGRSTATSIGHRVPHQLRQQEPPVPARALAPRGGPRGDGHGQRWIHRLRRVVRFGV